MCGPFTLSGTPDLEGTVAYGPRRTVLDKVLLDAAIEAGSEVREGFSVESMVHEHDHVIGYAGTGRAAPPSLSTRVS